MPFAGGILQLPLEILDEIIGHVEISAPDLLTLRCVNKALCGLVTPTAFREIIVRTTEKSAQGFLELLASIDIAKYVRVLEFIEGPDIYQKEFQRDEEERFERVRNDVRAAFFMLHLIPSLESLVITFYPEDHAGLRQALYQSNLSRYRLFHFEVFEGLARNPNLLPALHSLHINAWPALTDDLYDQDPFERIVESLRDLRFNVQDTLYNSEDDDFTPHEFWTYVIGRRVLQPAVNLTSLAMESSVGFGLLTRIDLRSITFPCLQSLSLSGFAWNDTRLDPQCVTLEVEEFIVRHGKTLKKLELQRCSIIIRHTRTAPVRSWTTVWNRFADQLTELVDLNVEYSSHHQRYVQQLPGYAFSSHSTFAIPGTEQDIPTLEALTTVVKRRNG